MARRFPLAPTTPDKRFTFGLVLDVAEVLAAHGYDDITTNYAGAGRDFVALQQALFRFLYAAPTNHDKEVPR